MLQAYLSDIFSRLNYLNINLQCYKKNILLIADKYDAFIKTLGI
jgi:hypothetical protein